MKKSLFNMPNNNIPLLFFGSLIVGILGVLQIIGDKQSASFLYCNSHFFSSSLRYRWLCNINALMHYVWGNSAYIVIASMIAVLILITRYSFKQKGEVIISWLTLPVTIAAFFCWYNGSSQGGLIGLYLINQLKKMLDPFCIPVLLYGIILLQLVIITFPLCLWLGRQLIKLTNRLLGLSEKHRIFPYIFSGGSRLVYLLLLLPGQYIASFILVRIKKVLFNSRFFKKKEAQPTELINYFYALKSESESSFESNDSQNEFTSLVQQDQLPPCAVREMDDYKVPSIHLFTVVQENDTSDVLKNQLQARAYILENKLERFGIKGNVTDIKKGPFVTLFEYQPDSHTKLSKIIALEDDLAMALQALSIRILAPIPGRSVVGFEVANTTCEPVYISSIMRSAMYSSPKAILPLILGKDTVGDQVVVDLVRMPHLLIAGSTGSGKSMALNTMLMSLLCRLTPSQLKLILIDPKRLEFMSYNDIAHLVFPIITDCKQVVYVLKWVVNEMENRYENMAKSGQRNLEDYNQFLIKHGQEPLPFIVIIIDELSDLMLTVGREIEDLITRITQMARAAGIHMIVATQRPSVDVITGLIKVNFPSRISFRVTSRVDSRTILDCTGADKLLGRGDMLFLDAATSQLRRVHGALVTTQEIEEVVQHIKQQRAVQYQSWKDMCEATQTEDRDEIYHQVLDFLQENDHVSISQLQRKFRIGYNRSARIIDNLEAEGLIMPPDGSKTRKIIR